MIYCDIEDLKKYTTNEIYNFIINLKPDIKVGRHIINESAYLNIDEYETKESPKLEAHKKYLDIQFVLEGAEKVYTTELGGLEVLEPYNEAKDVTFYKTPISPLNLTYLTKGKFIILYPKDVHGPCVHFDNAPVQVKKGIVKIAL